MIIKQIIKNFKNADRKLCKSEPNDVIRKLGRSISLGVLKAGSNDLVYKKLKILFIQV